MSPAALVGLIAAAGVTGLTTAAGGLTLVGGLLASAIGLGINLAIQAIIGQPKAPKPQEVKNVIQQSVPPRRRIYGKTRVGGKLLAIETINGDLWQIIYVCQGEIEGFVTHYLDDRTAGPLSPEGHVLAAPWQTLDGADSFVHIRTRRGLPDQSAFNEFIDAVDTYGGVPAVWSEDHQAKGCAVVMLRTSGCSSKVFTRLYPNRVSQWNGEVEGAKIGDPRIGGSPRYYNPATPGYVPGQNLPLITLDVLTHPDGIQIDPAYIDVEDFEAAADRADELLTTKDGGTVHRYYGQFVYDFDAEPSDHIKRLLNAVAGRLYLKANGKIGYDVGRWVPPTVHIEDRDIFEYDLDDRSGPLRDANEVIIKYTNPLSRYSEATCDPWRNEADISRIGLVKSTPLEMFEIQNHNHARRIAKIESYRRGPRWQGVIKTNLRGMEAWEDRFIRVTIDEQDIIAETFELLAIEPIIGDNCTVLGALLRIASMPAEAFAFDPETEEGKEPENPVDLSQDATPPPVDYEAHCEQRQVNGDTVPVLVATWEIGVERGDVSPKADFSIADTDDWFPMDVGSGYPFNAESPPVRDGMLYDVRIYFDLAGGAPGPMVVVENIPAIADIREPPKPIDTTIELIPPADVAVRVGFTAGDDPDNTRKVRIYRRPSGQPWDIDTATLVKVVSCKAGDSRTWRETPGSGTWIYDFVPYNGSGVRGPRSDFPQTVAVP